MGVKASGQKNSCFRALLLLKMIENPLFGFHLVRLIIYISGFLHIFGNNSAPKNISQCPETQEGPILLFFSQISPQKWIFTFFWEKEVPPNFFSLKNMLNFATFLLVAKDFLGNISRGSLTKQKCFSALLKKSQGSGSTLSWTYEPQISWNFFLLL